MTTTITGPGGVTITAEFITHTVIYHQVDEAEVHQLVTAIRAETHVSLTVSRDLLSLEG